MFDTPDPNRTLKTLFGAVVFVLGAQSIRFLIGSITWYLRDTVGIGVIDLIPIALAPFFAAALIPALSRWLTMRGALWAGVWVLVLARVVNQIATTAEAGFWSSAVGTMAFVGVLPLMLAMGRTTLVGGVLLGLALDSAIRGMGLSLDLAYQDGAGPIAAVIALAVAAVYLLWACPTVERQGADWGPGWSLLGLGPLLFFEFLILQNQGWTAEVAGIGGPQAQLRIALLNVLTLILVPRLERSRLATLIGIVTVVGAVAVAEGPELAFNLLSILAIPGAGLVLASLVPEVRERGIGPSAFFLITGMILFVAVGLAYYVPLDLDLGFGQSQARIGVLVLLVVFALVGMAASSANRFGVTSQTWAFAAVASTLPLFGLIGSGSVEEVEPVDPSQPLRYMSYNIHSAFDTAGRFDIEAIARVIEDSGATVVGLQEVPRGQLISGAADELTLLQERLGFEHAAFFGTSDPTWGNAILSRYPILSVDRAYLPQVGTPLRRGYLGATLDVGGLGVLFISTHLQHVNDSAFHEVDPEGDLYPVHTEQIEAILTAWGGRQPAVLVGDFNARPGWRQLDELLAAGWVDSWAEVGVGDGLTSSSSDPRHRIDYVFHTPDLVAIDAGVIQSEASDHFAVVAEIQPS